MKYWKGFLAAVVVLSLGVAAQAIPSIGVYFDEAATIDSAELTGGMGEIHTAYIFATDLDMVVGGAAFKLVLDPSIMLITATFPEGVQIGTVTAGVEMGLATPRSCFYGTPCLLGTLSMTTFDLLLDHVPLTIMNHPSYATCVVTDSEGPIHEADGHVSYLSIPVAAETSSWSNVKALYK